MEAPLYQESNKPENCANCIYGQIGTSCLLYNFQYNPNYICRDWARIEYLELERPHGFLIFRGKQTAIAADTDNLLTETPYLITSDDEAYGVATLQKAEKLALEAFSSKEWAKQHSTYEEERKRWWPNTENFYVYKIVDFKAFDDTYPIQDGKIIIYTPTEAEKALITKVQRMPRIISLNDKAVSIDLTGNVDSEINDLRIKHLLDSYFDKAEYKGIKAGNTAYPIYSLSLVRKPYIIPSYNKEHSSVMFAFFLDEATALAVDTLVATSIFPEDIVPFGASFTKPEEYHITLSILGKADMLLSEMETIMKVAETLAASYEPIKGKIGGLGRFTNKQEDGTVPFYLNFDSPKLGGFREELIERLEAVGIECNKDHGFTPHITIGYLPEETDTSRFKVPEFSLVFKHLHVAWGGDMFSFPFRIEEAEKEVEAVLKILPDSSNIKAIWTEEYLEKLPDENFLYISPSGERFLPYIDVKGQIDYGHIRSALSQVNKLNDEEGMPLSDEIKQEIRDKIIAILEKNPAKMAKAVWSGAYVNDLPDSAFLWVESGGEKDKDGNTKPRSLRHLPYKDSEGKIDLPHLRNAIAQTPKLKDKEGNTVSEAQVKKLQDKARKLLEDNEKQFKTSFIDTLKNYVKSAASYLGYMPEEPSSFDIDFKQPNGIGVKTVDGELWHFTWSSNSFIDRDKEIFSRKALETYVNDNFNIEQGAWVIEEGYFNFWHIPGTDFAEKRFQAIVGKFLVEAGPYLDNELGKKAKTFFAEYKNGHPTFAPEGWGASVEYRYFPEERVKGVYDWTYVDRTSTLPLLAAANTFTNSTQEAIMPLKEQTEQFEAASAIFGKEFVETLIKMGEDKTAALEKAGILNKQAKEEETPAEPETPVTEEPKVNMDVEEVIKGVTERLTLNVTELQKDFSANLTKVLNGVTELSERVKQLEEGTKTAEELTSQPRWEILLKNIASKAAETEVKADDSLISQKPEEAKPEEKKSKSNTIASKFFDE